MTDAKYLEAFGRAIRLRRLELELSQVDVAKAADISVTHYARIERGETNMTVVTLNQIAKVLKTTAAKLLPS